MSEEKDQRAPEPTEDVEGHMKGRMDDEAMKGMKGMKGANDEGDDVEGHMKGRMDDDEMKGMKGMKGANDEGDDDVEGHMRFGQKTP